MDIEVFSDASGATTTLKVQGWTFALDYLGEVKCRLLTQSNRQPPNWAADWARRVYWTELQKLVTPEWFATNRAMYAPEPSAQDRKDWAAEDKHDLKKEGG
jgi:hypothetical protein